VNPPAFGYLYSFDTEKAVTAGVNIDFDFAGPTVNTAPSIITDDITILSAATYEISAGLIAFMNTELVTFDIVVTGSIVPGSRFTLFTDSTEITTIGKMH
jgi:hypothetical protein